MIGLAGIEKPEQKAVFSKFLLDSKKKPLHFSALKNLDLAEAIMHDGRARTFTDRAGNTIIFGFYGCNEQGESVKDCVHPNPCRLLYDSGVFFGKVNPKIAEQNVVRNKRYQGSDGFRKSVRHFLAGEFDSPTGLIRFPYENTWIGQMERREANGYTGFPYIYLIDDVDPTTFTSVFLELLPYLLGAASAVLAITGVALSASVIALANIASATVTKFLKTGVLTIGDVSNLAYSLAPTLIGDNEIKIGNATSGMKAGDVQKLIKTGNDLYGAVAQKDYFTVARILGSEDNQIEKLVGSIKNTDVMKFASLSLMPFKEAEKVINSMQNNEMIRGFMLDGEKILRQVENLPTPLANQSIQQFLVGAIAKPDMAAVIPGATMAIKAMTSNMDLSAKDYQSLLELAQPILQNETFAEDKMLDILAQSMIEKAKHFVGNDFVIPSNIPSYMQGQIAKLIRKEVPGVNVVGLNSLEHIYYPQFA